MIDDSLKIRLLLLWSFDQRRRAEVNSSVSVRINSHNNRTADFIRLVNEEGFDDKLRVATENSASDEAAELKKTLIPLVQIVGHNVKWSAIERKGTLGRLYAMFHFFFSANYIWNNITINEGLEACNSTELSKLCSRNPVASDILTNKVDI